MSETNDKQRLVLENAKHSSTMLFFMAEMCFVFFWSQGCIETVRFSRLVCLSKLSGKLIFPQVGMNLVKLETCVCLFSFSFSLTHSPFKTGSLEKSKFLPKET